LCEFEYIWTVFYILLSYHTLPSSLSPWSCHCFLVALLVAHKVAHEGSSCAPFKIMYIEKHIKKPIVKIDSVITVHSINFICIPCGLLMCSKYVPFFIPLRVNSHCPAVRPYRFCDRFIVFCFPFHFPCGQLTLSNCETILVFLFIPYPFLFQFLCRSSSFSSIFWIPFTLSSVKRNLFFILIPAAIFCLIQNQ
jgi:hypothetical protein